MKQWVLAAALALTLSCAVYAQEREDSKGATPQSEEAGPEMPGWMWINFAILVGGLGYLVAKSVPALLRARHAEILQGIDEAARHKQQAEAQSADIDRRMAGLGADIDKLRQAVKDELAIEAERLKQDTERLVRRIEEQAQQEIGFLAKAATQQLRTYSAELALDLAEQRIHRLMNRQTQHELVDDFVARMHGMEAATGLVGQRR